MNELSIQDRLAAFEGVKMVEGCITVRMHDNSYDTLQWGLVQLPPEYRDWTFKAVYHVPKAIREEFLSFVETHLATGVLIHADIDTFGDIMRVGVLGFAGREYLQYGEPEYVSQTRQLRSDAD